MRIYNIITALYLVGNGIQKNVRDSSMTNKFILHTCTSLRKWPLIHTSYTYNQCDCLKILPFFHHYLGDGKSVGRGQNWTGFALFSFYCFTFLLYFYLAIYFFLLISFVVWALDWPPSSWEITRQKKVNIALND